MAAVRASPALALVRPHRSPPSLTPSAEDCLARIAELMATKGYARVTDIAAALGISSPSVTARVQQLARRGLLRYERYRGLTLTGAGARQARRQLHRRRVLTEFLTLLELDPATVAHDVERLEHHWSGPALERLEQLVAHWQRGSQSSA